MKKNFLKKKLALTLAVALVVASVSVPASAATAAKIVKQGGAKAPTVLYVGNAKADYSLSKTTKGTVYTWTTSNKAIATVAKTTGVVTAKAPGTVKVICTAKTAKGKWLKNFTKTVSIKLRATSINIGSEDFTLATGETKDLDAVKTPGKSTDAVRYYSDKTDVATVNVKTGVVTAVNAGKATITAYAKSTWMSKNASKYNKLDTVVVTVPVGVVKAEQTKSKVVKLTFNSDVKDLVKLADIAIVKEETKQVIAINKVELDGKVATVTTFADMNDGKVYAITFAGKTINVTATDNVVASLAFSTATVPFETGTEVKVSTVDAKGIILGEFDLNETEAKLDFSITTTQGYTVDKKLLLFKIGDTAKATATYHTFKYDTNGNEIGAIKAEATITAIDKTPFAVKESKYTIAKNAPDWSKASTVINAKLAIKDQNFKLFFYVKDNNDKVAETGYTFESSNNDVLLVSNNSGISANVIAVAQGTAYVLVKNADNKILFSLPVTIVAERKLASLITSSETLTLSNAINVADKKTLTVEQKDQYSDKMAAPSTTDMTVKCLSTSAVDSAKKAIAVDTITNNPLYYTTATGKVIFNGSVGTTEVPVGTYVYSIKVGDYTRTVTVNVKTPDLNVATYYQLEMNTNAVDTTFDGSSSDDKNIVIKVAGIKGTAVASYGAIGAIGTSKDGDIADDKIVIKKGSDVVTGASIVTTLTGTTITFKALGVNGSNVVSKAAAGSYSVEITYDGIKLNSGFVITDTQAGVTVARVATNYTGSLEDGIAKVFTFTYEGKDLKIVGSDIVAGSIKETHSGNTYSITSVIINVKVSVRNDAGATVTYTVPTTVTIEKSFTLN